MIYKFFTDDRTHASEMAHSDDLRDIINEMLCYLGDNPVYKLLYDELERIIRSKSLGINYDRKIYISDNEGL